MTSVFLDNDVLHKTIAYGVLENLLQSCPLGANTFSMLGAARYILEKKLKKCPPSRGLAAALAGLHVALQNVKTLEPTESEIRCAASFELAAIQQNVSLDSGESLLCAALLSRASTLLFTGDKRAIAAVQALLQAGIMTTDIERRIVCLEQLFYWMLHQAGPSLRTAICAEPTVDRSLTICFCCHSSASTQEEWESGLHSYIDALKAQAFRVLFQMP